MSFLRSRFAILFSNACLAAASFAQQTPAPAEAAPGEDPTIRLETILVRDERGAALTVPDADSAADRIAKEPGGAELIGSDRLRRGRASTLADTFALSPGVFAQPRFGADEARLSIRGSGLQRTFHGRGLRVLQDGVPINLADGGFDMQSIEPLAASHVNVWRGGGAPASGGASLGGVIDYVSPTGHSVPHRQARIEAGSWDYRRAHLAGGGAVGAWDGYASFSHNAQDSFRAHAEQETSRLFSNGAIRLSESSESRFYLTGVRTRSELPGSLTLAQALSNPRQAAAGNVSLDQRRDFDLVRLANRTTVRVGETLLDFSAAWSSKQLDHPIFQVIDQDSDDGLFGFTATRSGELQGRQHRLQAGVLASANSVDAANYANVAGSRGALISRARQRAANLELFIEDRMLLASDLTLVLGGQWSQSRRVSDPRFGSASNYRLDFDRFMPKAGLLFDVGETRLFAQVSDSFEAPSHSESLTGGSARRAQKGTTFEVGARSTFGRLKWDIVTYHAELTDELLAIDHDNNPSTPAITSNAGPTTHSGIEVGSEALLWGEPGAENHRILLRGAYTYGRFRFDDDPLYGNRTLAGLPAHFGRAELAWQAPGGWETAAVFSAASRSWIDHRNTFAAPGYGIWGLRLSREIDRGWGGYIELRNIADRRTIATTGVIENANGADQAQFLPGDGRGLFAGLNYAW